MTELNDTPAIDENVKSIPAEAGVITVTLHVPWVLDYTNGDRRVLPEGYQLVWDAAIPMLMILDNEHNIERYINTGLIAELYADTGPVPQPLHLSPGGS